MLGRSTSTTTYGPSGGEEFVAILVALDEAEHQVFDVEISTPHSMAMVQAQCLLVLGRAEDGDITCFI